MKSINRELIPNKYILSCEYWENMEEEKFLLSVTRGMATKRQKEECYQIFFRELTDIEFPLNDRFFKAHNVFELWYEGNLIGLCQNTAIARDWLTEPSELDDGGPYYKNRNTLFITCSLEAVFILKEYRDKDFDYYFSTVIREEQFKQMLGLITHQKEATFSHIDNHFFCEYTSKDEQYFHRLLFSGDNASYAQRVLTKLGCTYNVKIAAGY